MKKKKKKNPLILVAVIVAVIVVVLLVLNAIGIDLFATLGGMSEGKPTSFCNVNDLESGRAYVWHHDGGSIEEDLEKAAERDVYFTCITGDYNFKNQELEEVVQYPRSIWIESGVDDSIPTVGAGDYLIYVSKTEVPDGIVFERFADYGYTIGVSNMIPGLVLLNAGLKASRMNSLQTLSHLRSVNQFLRMVCHTELSVVELPSGLLMDLL